MCRKPSQAVVICLESCTCHEVIRVEHRNNRSSVHSFQRIDIFEVRQHGFLAFLGSEIMRFGEPLRHLYPVVFKMVPECAHEFVLSESGNSGFHRTENLSLRSCGMAGNTRTHCAGRNQHNPDVLMDKIRNVARNVPQNFIVEPTAIDDGIGAYLYDKQLFGWCFNSHMQNSEKYKNASAA